MLCVPLSGPVLPHLDACAGSVQRLASTATQLHSLALSRYELGSTACISNATQLTALTLQHCGLNNTSLGGLASLQQLRRLELSDNFLTAASLGALVQLSNLTHLDLSVMPSISRMRASSEAGDIWALGKLHSLKVHAVAAMSWMQPRAAVCSGDRGSQERTCSFARRGAQSRLHMQGSCATF